MHTHPRFHNLIQRVLGSDADEDDGYVLSYLSNWNKDVSYFVIFDAKCISKGESGLNSILILVIYS